MNWYLIQTKPKAHLIASKQLERQNFETFLPLILKTSKSSNKFVTKTVPLFPSYLFIGSNLEKIPWKSVNATRGVSKVVTLDGNYRPLNDEIVLGLKTQCDSNNILKKGTSLKAGDRVKIEIGPFSDFICEVEKIKDDQRIWVFLELLQQKARSLVRLNDVTNIV